MPRAGTQFVCALRRLGGLKEHMTRSAHLRLVSATPRANTCAAPSCELPAAGGLGLCGPCEAVYASLLVLCERLLARDIARLEHDTPGLTAAVYRALADTSEAEPAPLLPVVAPPAAWLSLLPFPEDLRSVAGLLSEGEAALREAGGLG